MNVEKILAISGKPGLYELKVQTRSGFVAESLLDGKKIKSEGWWNEAVYAYFNKEEILCIKRPNREDQQWIIRKIDLEVDDYMEVTNEK